jgi:hypothetical protein
MFDPPQTKEEARKRRYRTWAGNPGGNRYIETRCAYSVPDRSSESVTLSHE